MDTFQRRIVVYLLGRGLQQSHLVNHTDSKDQQRVCAPLTNHVQGQCQANGCNGGGEEGNSPGNPSP
jgi:hypothetical protein